MRRLCLSILCLVFSAATGIAQSVIVQAGEHINFTRISFSNTSLDETTIEREGNTLLVSFKGDERDFNTNAATNRLNANRVSDLFERDGAIHIALNCPCPYAARQYSGNVISIDIFETSPAESVQAPEEETQVVKTPLDASSALDRQAIAAIADDFVSTVIQSTPLSKPNSQAIDTPSTQPDAPAPQNAESPLPVPIVEDVSRYVTRGILTANAANPRPKTRDERAQQRTTPLSRSDSGGATPDAALNQSARSPDIRTYSQMDLCKTLNQNAAESVFSPALPYAALAETLGADQVIQIGSVLNAVGNLLSHSMQEEARHLVGWWLQTTDASAVHLQLAMFLEIGDTHAEAVLTSKTCKALLTAVQYLIRLADDVYPGFKDRAQSEILRPLDTHRQVFVAFKQEDDKESWRFTKRSDGTSEPTSRLYDALSVVINEADPLSVAQLENHLAALNDMLAKSGLDPSDALPVIESLAWQMRDAAGDYNLSNLHTFALLELGRLEDILLDRPDIFGFDFHVPELAQRFLHDLTDIQSDARFLNLVFALVQNTDTISVASLPPPIRKRLDHHGFSDLDDLETGVLGHATSSAEEASPNENSPNERTIASDAPKPNKDSVAHLPQLGALMQKRSDAFELNRGEIEKEISNAKALLQIWNEI